VITPQKFIHNVTFQNRGTTLDAYNQKSSDWTDVKTLKYCDVSDLQGRELANAQAIHAEVTVSITTRGYSGWRDEITPDMRAVSDGRKFDIKAVVNPDGRDREIHILAKEIVR
jgi:SPP1 family predicted phage head-tail adaptor